MKLVRRDVLTEERIRAYSRRGNYHSEPETARALGLPGLVAQGTQALGPGYGALVDAWGDDFIARGVIDVKFVGTVLAGHEIEAIVRRMSANAVTRRKFLAATGFASMSAFIAACSSGGTPSAAPSSAPSEAAPSAAPSSAAPSQAAEPSYATEGALYMYNWADYINPENIEEYQARYSISDWTYDTYASNEELVTRLQGGATGLYDICSPTCEFVP